MPKGKYGYTYTPRNKQTNAPGSVTIHEQHAEIVVRIYARRADLERQAAYVLRCARETAIAPTLLEAQLKEIEAEQERVRIEEARLETREALAREAAP